LGARGGGYGGYGGGASGGLGGPPYGTLIGSEQWGSGGTTNGGIGGHGGGTIIANITNLRVNGTIQLDGSGSTISINQGGGGGSGGALIIPKETTVTGAGTIALRGETTPDAGTSDGGGGGGGRLTIYGDLSGFTGNINVSGGSSSTANRVGYSGSVFRCANNTAANCPGTGNGITLTSLYDKNHSVEVNRTLILFNTLNVVWNDSSSNSTATGTYTLTGMQASTDFEVLDNGIQQTIIQSDSSGNLGPFSVTLSSEHEINVTEFTSDCGTITENLTLINNLTSDDTCITIAANNIELRNRNTPKHIQLNNTKQHNPNKRNKPHSRNTTTRTNNQQNPKQHNHHL
jgi:hypothetical protein